MKIFIIVPLDFKFSTLSTVGQQFEKVEREGLKRPRRSRNPPVARLVRAATDRNPPTLGGGGCQVIQRLVGAML
jgi:hypothetical protein